MKNNSWLSAHSNTGERLILAPIPPCLTRVSCHSLVIMMHTGTDDEAQSCTCPTGMFQNTSLIPMDCRYVTKFCNDGTPYKWKTSDCGEITCKWSKAFVPPKWPVSLFVTSRRAYTHMQWWHFYCLSTWLGMPDVDVERKAREVLGPQFDCCNARWLVQTCWKISECRGNSRFGKLSRLLMYECLDPTVFLTAHHWFRAIVVNVKRLRTRLKTAFFGLPHLVIDSYQQYLHRRTQSESQCTITSRTH